MMNKKTSNKILLLQVFYKTHYNKNMQYRKVTEVKDYKWWAVNVSCLALSQIGWFFFIGKKTKLFKLTPLFF